MAIQIDTNRPSSRILLISLVIMVIAVIGHLTPRIQIIAQYHFWIAVLGYIVLLAGTLDKRL